MSENPFYVQSAGAEAPAPCAIVIFGATGDLTQRKLVPALFNLRLDGLLPTNFFLVNFARREFDQEAFRNQLGTSVAEYSRRRPIEQSAWDEFASHSLYVQGSFDDPPAYIRLKEALEQFDREIGTRANRLFYCATSPEYFQVIASHLAQAGLLEQTSGGQGASRVIVEKPFGTDLQSALELNRALSSCMSEDQIYRIDHYLGKETVQNLLVFRFANGIFEPIWNHKYIDHVEISVGESIGVGSRAGYFDQSGILRDIVQNHAFQLLCLVALEPPVAFEADPVRDEKVKVLRSIRRLSAESVSSKVVRGRYLNGSVGGEFVQGYLAEPGVGQDSTTETYVSLELQIDNWRWAGVPFYIRAGKRLPKKVTEISIFFRQVPHTLFQDVDVKSLSANVLSFQIQPDEGISLKISSKPPGPKVQVQPVKMDFSYGTSFGIEPPEAYERLLLDAMRGDPTLFTRDDEIEQAWDIVDPILNAWAGVGVSKPPPVYGYESGTWGPKAAEELISKRLGHSWRRL